MIREYRIRSTALLFTGVLLAACSSESGDPVFVDSSGHEPAADLVEFRLASFAGSNLDPVRSLPTDRTPRLFLTKGGNDGATFATTGSGVLSSRCIGLSFEYRYEQDANAGRNRLVIDRVEDNPRPEDAGCDAGNDVFESAAFDVAIPSFFEAGSMLSDFSDTLLTLYGPESGVLSFQLEADLLAQTSAALSLDTFRWTVLAYRFGASPVTPAPATDPLFIRFDDDGDLVGKLRCQSLSGSYETQESLISFSNVSFTESGCASQTSDLSEVAYLPLREAVTMVMSGPAFAILQGSRLYLSANDATLVLEGREAMEGERLLNTSLLATGGYPIPDAANGPQDVRLVQTLRDTDEFNAFWNEAIAQGNDLGPPPAIDFTQGLVMYLQLGLRPHLGESIAVRSATANDEHVLIEVDTRISDNDVPLLDGCGYDDALVNPFRFVLISDSLPLPEAVAVIDHQSSSCSGL
ncbi:META domain-containing protein [Granulosicoccus sp. 3-233]|uniref:META domain-containing protein n=1 Tax=Granulosicoccus sp. 3-233 TaxID=3417969 RepID=UPI003D349F90